MNSFETKFQDQHEIFINVMKEKCNLKSGKLLEMIVEKNNEYVVSFDYKDSKEILQTKPMKKEILFLLLDAINKCFKSTIEYKWIDNKCPLLNKNGYFNIFYDENTPLHLMNNIEILKTCDQIRIKCDRLIVTKTNYVIFKKDNKFYSIDNYDNFDIKNIKGIKDKKENIETGLAICNTIHTCKIYELNCPQKSILNKNKEEHAERIFLIFLIIILVGLLSLLGCFICYVSITSSYEDKILGQNKLINNLQLNLENHAAEYNNTINLLKEANFKIEKLEIENTNLIGRRIEDIGFILFLIIMNICLFVMFIFHNRQQIETKQTPTLIKNKPNSTQNKNADMKKNIKNQYPRHW